MLSVSQNNLLLLLVEEWRALGFCASVNCYNHLCWSTSYCPELSGSRWFMDERNSEDVFSISGRRRNQIRSLHSVLPYSPANPWIPNSSTGMVPGWKLLCLTLIATQLRTGAQVHASTGLLANSVGSVKKKQPPPPPRGKALMSQSPIKIKRLVYFSNAKLNQWITPISHNYVYGGYSSICTVTVDCRPRPNLSETGAA